MQEASHVLEQLVGEFKSKFAHSQHQQGVLGSFKAFTAAVDWKVSLMLMLHMILMLTCTLTLMMPFSSCIRKLFAGLHVCTMFMQEPWLIAVLSVQTLLFSSVILYRRNTSYLTGVFIVASKHTSCCILKP